MGELSTVSASVVCSGMVASACLLRLFATFALDRVSVGVPGLITWFWKVEPSLGLTLDWTLLALPGTGLAGFPVTFGRHRVVAERGDSLGCAVPSGVLGRLLALVGDGVGGKLAGGERFDLVLPGV